jgi:HAD superfamily hydrolase (TIGR01509 family)
MDGTLFDTELLFERAETQVCAELGYTMTREIYLGTVGLPANGPHGWRAYLLNVYGPNFPIDEMSMRVYHFVHEAIAQHGLPIKPGAIELLDWLDAARLPRAIASSSTREMIARHLRESQLTQRFALVVGGDEVAQGKPAPDIFLEAAHRLAVAPAQCLVLEDSEAGVRAAHAAGMVTIMIPDLKSPSQEIRHLAHHIMPSLHDVLAWLAAWAQSAAHKC